MKLGSIEVVPVAAESMGVRSLCTRITTPDVNIVFDPSAALAKRFGLEPHPAEYRCLLTSLERIFAAARHADVLSISHYHYDHVRPGFTDFRYLFSSREELQRMFEGKTVFAKDNRENINASQRRRGFYFQKDLEETVREIRWADGQTCYFGATTVSYSEPLPHGSDNSPMGYVLATAVQSAEDTVLFAPDVQGPLSERSLSYILNAHAGLIILGGPPIYLNSLTANESETAVRNLCRIARSCPVLIVDHHLTRSEDWEKWIRPVRDAAGEVGHKVLTMAELAGIPNQFMEASRKWLYEEHRPTEEFLNWASAADEFKTLHRPPIDS